MKALLGALDDAVAGHGRVLLLGGEPGIGKTRLAEEFAARATRDGALVVWGRSWEAGGAPAYWPWIQSLRSVVASIGVEAALPGGDAGSQLRQILPELADHGPDRPDVSKVSPESARFDLFVAVSQVLQRAAQDRPLALILDDLHAADASSLLLLRFVAASANEHRILVLGTYRDIELTKDHPLTATLPELLRASGAARVAMTGLSEDDVARLIDTSAGLESTPDLVAAIHDRTDGNPLFVQEYVRLVESEDRLADAAAEGRWPVPEGVRDVIGRRLDRLSATCMELLHVAAVAGRDFAVETVARATGQRADVVLASLQEAIAARLVEEVQHESGRLRFAHALMRDTIYDELLPAVRCRLHHEVATALEGGYTANPEPFVAELAHHFFAAGPFGDPAKTMDYAVAAGTGAVAALAYEEAVRLFQMALQAMQESPDERRRCEILVQLGDAHARAGDQPTSKETFLAAAAIATRIGDPELLARTALGYAGRFMWARAGTDSHLIPLLRQALDALPSDDDALRARLLARLAGALRDQPSLEPRASLGAEAVAMARRIGDPETLTYALLGWCFAALLGPDELERQFTVAAELDELAQKIGDRELRTNALWVRYIASLTRGDSLEVRRQHDLLNQLAEELHQGSQLWYARVMATVVALQDGRFDEAEALFEQALAVGRQAQGWDANASRLFALFVLRREQGRLVELEADLRRALATHPGYRSVRCMLLGVLVGAGRRNEGRGLFEQLAADEFAGFPKDNEWLFAMTQLAEAAASLHDEQRAHTLYGLLAPYSNLVALAASEASVGPVARPLGMLAGTLGQFDTAEGHFEAAVELCERMGARPWAAHSRYDHAAMLVARGRAEDRRRALELATAAHAAAQEMGMTVLIARVESLLSGAGSAPAAISDEAGRLTRREREVAGLVAAGLSNRQIAEQLFVSERTAETHVQNIFTKLGFTSRSQVAAWAVREELGTTT